MDNLIGKTALVIGAARGIGRVMALRLASLGANVGIIDEDLHSYKVIPIEDELMTADSVVEELRNMGVKAAGHEAYMGNKEQAFAAVEAIAKELGDIDILVCNAGGNVGNPLGNRASEMDLDQFHAAMERNLYSTVYAVNAVAPMMKKNQYGKIITVSSHAGLNALSNGFMAPYGITKGSIVHYTKVLAQDLGRYNINCNCIAEGFIDTGLTADLWRKFQEPIFNAIAIKRFGTPEDCANAVEFLATNLSDYTTGAVIPVNGGSHDRFSLFPFGPNHEIPGV